MTISDTRQLAASIVFLVVYIAFLITIVFCIFTRRPLRRFIGLTLFSTIRMGSMVSGIGFAVVGYQNFNWLVAYLVLGAEGYFALILTALYIMAGYQRTVLGSEYSWIEPEKPKGMTWAQTRKWRVRTPAFWFHMLLIPGNILVIYGGSRQSTALSNSTNYASLATAPAVVQGSHLRTAGQALFLFNAFMIYAAAIHTLLRAKKLGKDPLPIYLILATFPFMLIRGVFAILSAADWDWSYYNPENYGAEGLGSRQLVGEYVLGTTMECIAAFLLFYDTFLLSKRKSVYLAERAEMTGQEMGSRPVKGNGAES